MSMAAHGKRRLPWLLLVSVAAQEPMLTAVLPSRILAAASPEDITARQLLLKVLCLQPLLPVATALQQHQQQQQQQRGWQSAQGACNLPIRQCSRVGVNT
jgi:hypothetical protein